MPSGDIRWVEAGAEHRAALRSFICTTPERASYGHHPRPWELEVQSSIREFKAPPKRSEVVLLGFDSEGLAAVVKYTTYRNSPGSFFINAVAVAHRRRQGGAGSGIGQLALRAAFTSMVERSVGMSEIYVEGKVHPLNRASQRMNTDFGMSLDASQPPDHAGNEMWSGLIPIPHPADSTPVTLDHRQT